jgi:hypothetical protein
MRKGTNSKEEISMKEFYELSKADKDSYIKALLLMKDEELSGTQSHILKFFGPQFLIENKKFFTMDEQISD